MKATIEADATSGPAAATAEYDVGAAIAFDGDCAHDDVFATDGHDIILVLLLIVIILILMTMMI